MHINSSYIGAALAFIVSAIQALPALTSDEASYNSSLSPYETRSTHCTDFAIRLGPIRGFDRRRFYLKNINKDMSVSITTNPYHATTYTIGERGEIFWNQNERQRVFAVLKSGSPFQRLLLTSSDFLNRRPGGKMLLQCANTLLTGNEGRLKCGEWTFYICDGIHGIYMGLGEVGLGEAMRRHCHKFIPIIEWTCFP